MTSNLHQAAIERLFDKVTADVGIAQYLDMLRQVVQARVTTRAREGDTQTARRLGAVAAAIDSAANVAQARGL
jgi:hypothetical protein